MSGGVLRVGVEAVALRAPGLPNWIEAKAALTGAERYRVAAMTLEAPALLSPAERRRAIPAVKLALAVGVEAVAESGRDPKSLPVVFASSGADGEAISAILAALAAPGREVSPTRFHNSVHNAPSGYWGIAVQSQEPVTSLSAYDASFAAGLLEACVQCVSGGRPVLLIAYDLPYPEPLDGVRHVEASFGVALMLNPGLSDGTVAELGVRIAACPDGEATGCSDDGLENLRRSSPAARSLPLLALLAAGSAGDIRLDLTQGALEVSVRPC